MLNAVMLNVDMLNVVALQVKHEIINCNNCHNSEL
jgi:hypothetical protein